MYDDYAMLDVEKFETVAREYAKITKASILNEGDECLCLIKQLCMFLLNLKNISVNKINKQKIENLINNVSKGFNINLTQQDFNNCNINKMSFCQNVKQIVLIIVKIILKMKDEQKMGLLNKTLDCVLEFITDCKYRKD